MFNGVTKELFVYIYLNVITRCFGWVNNSIVIITVADTINHSAIDEMNESIDLEMHKKAISGILDTEAIKKYATKDRLKFDISDITGNCTDEFKECIKEIIINDETKAVCIDINNLDLVKNEYNIWNVYEVM